jgi:7-carboxy-7-deazaguanine synthase
LGGSKVTITGGEPLIQGEELNRLTKILWHSKFHTSIETNGTLPTVGFYGIGSWVVDFKLPSSGHYDEMEHSIFTPLNASDFVKFVIMDRNDYDTAIREKKHLQSIGCRARFAFSPAFGPKSLPVNNITKHLVKWLIEDKQFDTIISVQIHKILNVP